MRRAQKASSRNKLYVCRMNHANAARSISFLRLRVEKLRGNKLSGLMKFDSVTPDFLFYT